jgi:hypothetical protein
MWGSSEADLHRFYQLGSWKATLELAEINGPHGFMRYYSSDVCALMAGSQSLWKATQYYVGNHTITERAFREDASAVLYAPMPALIYADPDGDTKFAVDQPSLLFNSYGSPQIIEVGHELDARLAQLIVLSEARYLPNCDPQGGLRACCSKAAGRRAHGATVRQR